MMVDIRGLCFFYKINFWLFKWNKGGKCIVSDVI